MTKDKAVSEYRKIAERLEELHGKASNHISRQDNNQVFEVCSWLRDLAERIEENYEEGQNEK